MSDLLQMDGITKRFPGVLALDNISLHVRKGEVHALLGENGAGKSTLMKILAGAYTMDAGKITFEGKPIVINSPRDAQAMGISIIYQELNLVPQMTVAENIFLSALLQKSPVAIDWKAIYRRAEELLRSLDIDIDVHTRVSNLGIAQQQMVEISKALNHEAKIIIMDEPTAPLTERETNLLFKTIEKLRSEGVSIIYISHRLEETMRIGDRATIMRDGRTVATVDIAKTSINEIIRNMVGHSLEEQFPPRDAAMGEVLFEAKNFSRAGVLENVGFKVRRGEVLGVCGLVGAGRTEAARAIFGIDPKDSGSVLVEGREVKITKPKDAIQAGIGFVTEDRKGEGLLLIRDCKENISLVALRNFERFIHLSLKDEARSCASFAEKLRVKTPSLRQKALNLSGGNQQKIVLAKWLMSDAKIFILDEPTRGIDVGAKVEVYNIINTIASSGKAVIMISSEMTELIGMCDRIVVMCRGRMIGEVLREDFSQERIMYLAAGGDEFIGQNA